MKSVKIKSKRIDLAPVKGVLRLFIANLASLKEVRRGISEPLLTCLTGDIPDLSGDVLPELGPLVS